MRFEEFKTLVITLTATFPAARVFDTDQGINIWFEMLKDIDYPVATEAVSRYIRESPYPPTIADIRSISRRIIVPDWSVEWHKLLKGAVLADLNAPAQYAVQTVTEDYVQDMIGNSSKSVQCMKEFERLYQNYFKLSAQDKEALKELGVWKEERIGMVRMQPKLLITKDGRVLE